MKKYLVLLTILSIIFIMSSCLTKDANFKSDKIEKTSFSTEEYLNITDTGEVILKKDLKGLELQILNADDYTIPNGILSVNTQNSLMIAKIGEPFKKGDKILVLNKKADIKILSVAPIEVEKTKISSDSISDGISIIDEEMNKDGYGEVTIYAKNVMDVTNINLVISYDKDLVEIDQYRGENGVYSFPVINGNSIIMVPIINSEDGEIEINLSTVENEKINLEDNEIFKIYFKAKKDENGKGKIGISKIQFANDPNSGEERSIVISSSGNVDFHDGELKLREPKLLGDFNNDNIVDISDVKAFANYSNTKEGNSSYDEAYDIAPAYNMYKKEGWENIYDTSFSDGSIDINDFSIIAANFDKSKPNNFPLDPIAVNPKNGEESNIQPILKWYSEDPDGDLLTYDIYFGESQDNLSLLATNISFSSDIIPNYDITKKFNKLEVSTDLLTKTYYWKVVVKDTSNATSESVFSFYTEKESNLKPSATTIENQEVFETETLIIDLTKYFADEEGDEITYSRSEESELKSDDGLEISSEGTLTFTPDYDMVTTGNSVMKKVVIKAWDSQHVNDPTKVEFYITIKNKNRLPQFTETLFSPASINNNGSSIDTENIQFNWSATDPDGESIKYYFYLGKTTNYELIKGEEKTPPYTYNLTTLEEGTTYYWKVVAKDSSDGEISSDLLTFTTRGYKNGGQKYVKDVENPIRTGVVISPENVIHFGSNDENFGKLYSILPTGQEKRSPFLVDSPITTTPAVDNDGNVYFGTLEGKLYSVNVNNTSNWEYIIGVPLYSSPAIGVDAIYIGATDGYFYSIDKDSGNLNWKYQVSEKIKASPVLDNSGNIYFGAYNGIVYSLDKNGNERFSVTLNVQNVEEVVAAGAIDNTNKKLYIGTLAGKIYAIDIDTTSANYGKVVSSNDLGAAIKYSPVVGDSIYVITQDGKVHALKSDLSKETGKLSNGEYDAKIEPAGPISLGTDGTNNILYIPLSNGKIYSIKDNGTSRWVFGDAKKSISGNIAIGKDGNIYAGSLDNKFYIIYDSQNEGIAKTEWPVFKRNSAATGGNRPPKKPYNLSPKNKSGKVDPATDYTISWKSKEYDGDSISYDVYFGENTNSLLLKSPDQNSESYKILESDLKYGYIYYWKIVAKDDNGAEISSDIYSFITKTPFVLGKPGSGSESKLVVGDISEKESPVQITSNNINDNDGVANNSEVNDIKIYGNYVYVAAGPDGFEIVDLSDPTLPTHDNEIHDDGVNSFNIKYIDVIDTDNDNDADLAILLDNTLGLITVTLTDGTIPVYYANDNTGLSDIRGSVYYNGNVYVIDGNNGLVVFGVDNSGNITHKKTYNYSGDSDFIPTAYNPKDIAVSGDYAYIADGENGLVVIDISTPDNPDVVDMYDYSNDDSDSDGVEDAIANTIFIYNGNAYIGYLDNDADDGINVNYVISIDLSDPETLDSYNDMNSISKIDLEAGTAEDIFVDDDYVYVAAGTGGLRIISLTKEAEIGYKNTEDMDNVKRIGGIWKE
ncbi:PQQ-binding-like beta-propeller repeat protein [Marinitoga sp. 38H-ov]|uniref:outer membrane protein assembly factor BamB family protein n=1 Tax=Marinitoga sp. 38H-ov TaxID=1755814 RepID=UPI0013ED32A9|nr:PQQ-binding-like beta-propeller repeat protein [Marinitoga sp. 38H-ov]KAF2956887.1 hypothetical protein AS160_03570 [Marinitoga sp. 38H-ov]